MSGRKWTAEQLNAINHRGGNLLIAAGAGSGKTSVLVERVIRLIGAGAAGDGSVGAGTPCKADAAADAGSDYIGLDRLLIVTFTNAAAAEMKERIAAALTERLEEIENRQLETIFIKTTVTSNADESSGESGEDGGNSGDSMDGYGGGGSNGVGGENGYGGDRDESADSSYGGDDSEEDYGGDSGNGSEFYEKRAERLRRQLILLDIASISTIHSFCHSVIKDNIHAVDGLDSGFRLMDDAEASLLRADALDDVLEEKYADETDESFTALVDSYVTGRDDRNIADVILRVFQFARSAPWPDEWLENMTSLFNVQSERDFCVSVWAGLILDRLAEELDSLNAVLRFYGDTIMQCIKNEKSKKEALHAIDELTRIRGLCGQAVNALNSDNAESKSYNEYADVADNVDNSDSAVDADNIKQVKNWRKLRGAIAALGDMACLCPRAARNEGEEIKIGREAVKAAVRQFTGGVVKDYFRLEIDDVRDEFTRSYALLRELSSVVGAFAQRYADLKRGRAVVDFNDLEHFAIKILLKRDAVTGRALPTEAAAAYRKKFAEVLIDEYQDINLVQEYILQAVSGGSDLYGCTGGKKGSVFMVGDVKQSIYRFRQAMPEIFIKKYLTYKTVKNTVDNNTLNLTVGNGEDGIANGNDADGITFGNADDGITVGNDAGDIIGVGVADAQNRQPEGEKILLYKNFRSEPHILTFVNLLFSAVMSKKAGELDYTKEEWLLPGVGAREAYGAVDFVEAHMIDREPPALRTARNAAVNAAATTNGATAEANNAAAAIKTDNAAATANAAMVKTDNAAAATKIKNAVVATKTNNNSASAVAADTAADVASAAAEGADAASPNAGADAGDASDNETPVDAIQEDFDNAVLEARYIARQIKQLMQSAGVPGDGGGTRRLAYRDIAVLMRAVRGTAPAFRDELIRLGVPAYTDSSSAYFETYEISVMLSLLKIIDNPLQDIPLLTVMLSPVFAFTAEEAALIRHAAKRAGAESSQSGGNAKYATNVDDDKDEDSGVDGAPRAGHMPLYDCLTYALNNYNNYNYNNNNNNNNIHGDLTGVNVGVSIGVGVGFGAGFGVDIGKIRAAIQAIGAWRRASVVKPVSELIWKLMHETGFYLHACAMPGGEQRRANLLKFFEYALEYEKISYKGIFSFIRFVDRMISQGEDFAEAKLIGENVDSVRILSIHKSKGLEYPVVFLAGCGKRFNLRDAADQLLLHRELGFGPNYVDLDRRIIDNTIAKKLLAGIIRNEAISEEMRILYVALTRAKSRLFLVGTLIGAERYVDKLQNTMAPYENAGGNRAGLPPEYALKANSYFYWVVSSRFAGNEFPLYTHKADEFAEPAAADGIATDGAATDGVSTVVVASVGASVDGAATDGVSTAGAASVGASAEPAVADGAAADSTATDDVAADGVTTDGASVDDNPQTIARRQDDASAAEFAPLPDNYAADLAARLSWKYPYEPLTHIPRKVSVSDIVAARTAARLFTDSGEDVEDDVDADESRYTGGGGDYDNDEILFCESDADNDNGGYAGGISHSGSVTSGRADIDNGGYAGGISHSGGVTSGRAANTSANMSANTGAPPRGRQHYYSDSALSVPKFLSGVRAFTRAQIGTFTHLVLEKADFKRDGNLDSIEALIAALAARETLLPEQAAAVDRRAIMNFFDSEAGRLAAAAERVNRETVFTAKLSLSEYFDFTHPSGKASAECERIKALFRDGRDEPFVLMQGSIDCWFDTPDGIALIDYKTGFAAAGDVPAERYAKYRAQIELYALALKKITGRDVNRKFICMLTAGRCIEI